MKRDFLKHAKDKENKKKDEGDAENKRVEVMGGQLHAMFISLGEGLLGTDFSKMGEDDKFTYEQTLL